MTMNPLPPQAYTKETLLKAYQWLMEQNSSIKEIATTPDALVSLYLKALRDGEDSLERPSIQNFKSELRNLAGMMGDLDRPANSAPHANHSVFSNPASSNIPANFASQASVPSVKYATAPQTQVSYTEKTLTASSSATNHAALFIESLDKSTYQMIQEVKQEFNLSSDLETVRMLIKFGYLKSQGMLK